MKSITGTAHFISINAAGKYYGKETARIKIEERAIVIGRPETKQGETLVLLDNGQRYGIKRDS